MSWKVSEVVAALPALLELAVVLFVTGIPLFLWTMCHGADLARDHTPNYTA
jgi:hypothetical protein